MAALRERERERFGLEEQRLRAAQADSWQRLQERNEQRALAKESRAAAAAQRAAAEAEARRKNRRARTHTPRHSPAVLRALLHHGTLARRAPFCGCPRTVRSRTVSHSMVQRSSLSDSRSRYEIDEETIAIARLHDRDISLANKRREALYRKDSAIELKRAIQERIAAPMASKVAAAVSADPERVLRPTKAAEARVLEVRNRPSSADVRAGRAIDSPALHAQRAVPSWRQGL